MWNIIKNGYRSGWTYMLACPLLFLFPVAIEMIQHAVEIHIGMYDSIEMAKATEHHPARMAFGMLKIAALTIAAYWVTRFTAFGHDREAPTRAAPQAVRLFAVYFLFSMVMAAIGLWTSSLSPTLMVSKFLLSQLISGGFLCWGVAAAIGNAAIGPAKSLRITGVHILWVGLFSFAVTLPLMIPHYVLGTAPLLANPGPVGLWLIMIADSLLVGLLIAIIAATGWYLADWLTRKKGVALMD